MPSDQLRLIARQLAQQDFYVNDTWLAQCVEYIEDTTGVAVSAGAVTPALVEQVVQQFLHSDLRVSRADQPRLPLEATQVHVASTTVGCVVLQVLEVVDVGVPALKLLDAVAPPGRGGGSAAYIRLDDNEGQDEDDGGDGDNQAERGRQQPDPKARTGIPRGMLKLTLTDGHRLVYGMEYRPLPNLCIDMEMGFKVRVRNVTVHRGVMLLASGSTQFLGGSASDDDPLSVPWRTTLAQKLRAQLKMPEQTAAAAAEEQQRLRLDRFASRYLVQPPSPEDLLMESLNG